MRHIQPAHRWSCIPAAVLLLAGLCLADGVAEPAPTPSTGDAISVPPLVNYQGKLTDPAGNPISGTRDMTFAIYDVAVGGTPVWTETQAGVVITSGLFNVLLGSVTPLSNIPDGPDCWLQVTVAGEAISPRVRIVSTGYSFNAGRAENANQLGGVPASGYTRAVTATAPLASSGGQTPNLTLNTTMGGDLTGSYPNPALTATGGTAGTYGADTMIPQLTVDAKGRLQGATSVRAAANSAYPKGNLLRYGAGTIYTVPTGKSFLLYMVSLSNYAWLQVNGNTILSGGGAGSGYSINFDPPMEFPAGTVFGNSTYAATVYGYEY